MRCGFHARNIHSLGGAYFLKTVLKHKNFSVEAVRRDCLPAPRFSLAVLENDFLKAHLSTQIFGPSLYAR